MTTWDQVLSFGEYQHVTVDDKPVITVFDASKCRAMLDDFEARKNDIFVDRRHEVVDATSELKGDELLEAVEAWGNTDGRALAWSDALCMVVAGVVVRYVRHASAPDTAPTLQDLQRPDGTNAEDGVYARRFRVTPLGADPKEGLPSFRYTSPYFVPLRDGWRLLNYTVTNDPRMEGVGLGAAPLAMQSSGCVRMGRQQMHRVAMSAAAKPETQHMGDMTPEEKAEMMKAAGCMEGDSPDMKHDKMMVYARKMAEDCKTAMSAKQKMESETAAKMEADKKAAEEMARKAEAEHKEPDGDEKAAMQAMSRKLEASQEKLAMMEKTVADLQSAVGPLAKAGEAAKERAALESAQAAIAMGRIPGDHKGDEAKTVAWLAGKYKEGDAVAEEFLFPAGKFKPSEAQVMTRLTVKGAGKGAPQPDQGDNTPGAKYVQAMSRARQKIIDQKLPAGTDPDLLVKRDEPEIHAAQWSR